MRSIVHSRIFQLFPVPGEDTKSVFGETGAQTKQGNGVREHKSISVNNLGIAVIWKASLQMPSVGADNTNY